MTTELDIPSVDEYLSLRRAVGWRELDREACATALGMSMVSVTHRVGTSGLLAHGRVVGDTLYGFLVDVMVHPSAHRGGLGKLVVRTAIESGQRLGMRSIQLVAHPSLEGYYASMGFRTGDNLIMKLSLAE
ncbi:GNAT family N-acetyltransferase [Streptomyces sp. NPDC093018]|uniref:GNAT family N-acetyltransferase n=1 Tax=Streptomyces sp. NPDC093018 TaxID=3155067 RepID=UPI00343CEE98